MTELVTILLVEDNDADARYVEELLYDHEHHRDDTQFQLLPEIGDHVEIQREESVTDAVDVLESASTAIDVILLDLYLGDSRGLSTVQTILDTTRKVPVVVLTGMEDDTIGANAVRAGAQDYLVKDEVTTATLVRAIRYAIERHQTASMLRERTEQLAIMNQLMRHDVRNDISLVVGRATELRNSVDDRHSETLTEIITASNHVLDLTRTIGDGVEAITERDESTLKPISLCPVLESEIETARETYHHSSIELHTSCEDIEVQADRLLSSVFRNILGNAIIYSDQQSPTVEVTVEATADTATVSFADDGPGIPPRQRQELFTRDSDSLQGSGLGIGLYLVRSLVEFYDGSIDISDNQPLGTVFTVSLPRC